MKNYKNKDFIDRKRIPDEKKRGFRACASRAKKVEIIYDIKQSLNLNVKKGKIKAIVNIYKIIALNLKIGNVKI